ncbi:MAG: hypothetical protein ACOH5I_15110 [Oligoflexus sp.]
MRYLTLLVLTWSILSACGDTKKEGNETLDEPSLDQQDRPPLSLTNFKEEAFLSNPIDQRCHGIEQFFLDFSNIYLEGTKASIEKECRSITSSNRVGFDLEIKFSNGSDEINLIVHVMHYLPESNIELNIRQRVGSSSFDFHPRHNPQVYNENLLHMVPTFEKWLSLVTDIEETIFDISYAEYLEKLVSLSSEELGGLYLKGFRIFLLPSQQDLRHGKVRISEIDPSFFEEYLASDSIEIFGCQTIECIEQSNKVSYEIVYNSLVLSHDIEEDDTTNFESFLVIDLNRKLIDM